MSAEDILRVNETNALNNNQFISHVTGKNMKINATKKKSLGALIFIVIVIVVFALFLSSKSLIPSMISDLLVQATDMQYADAVESKVIVFQQALSSNSVPENTINRLEENDILVGHIEDGEFVEGTSNSKELALKYNGEIIEAKNFNTAINNDVGLYDAFNKATYGRAAYYYDDAANQVFKKIGTNRDNYSKDKDFTEVMNNMIGSGSEIEVNNVTLVKETYEEDGETKEKVYYDTLGTTANSKDNHASDFINLISSKNKSNSASEATLNTANAINVADTISKEQKSSLLFLGFMENISKMKAGEGNDAKIDDVMSYLYKKEEVEVVDTKTGEVIKVTGSMMESPSMYAILSGERIDTESVQNYSSDRVLKTIENRIGALAGSIIENTVSSTAPKLKGSIGRYTSGGEEQASSEVISTVTPTVSSSLINNSFEDIKGISGGELLAEGAVNVGRELAKASGATAGDAEAVRSYARLNSSILAMDAKADRLNRSPFDITSKNTFLGSIIYKLATTLNNSNTFFGKMTTLSKVTSSAIASLLPTTYADDEADSYLTSYGDCETIGRIGAVGSPTCAMIATFDTSTLGDILNDAGFINFMEANTVMENGVRTIKQDSVLGDFIKYNDERQTPIGITDGGILNAVGSNSSISFTSDILGMVENFLGSSTSNKRLASGEAFVNSSSNSDWQTYKYAQRYVSLARALATLRQYDGGATAYTNIKFFEGSENPVVAFLNNYYNVANN